MGAHCSPPGSVENPPQERYRGSGWRTNDAGSKDGSVAENWDKLFDDALSREE